MTDNERQYISRMQQLKSFSATKYAKSLRNLRLYEYSPTLSLNSMKDDEVVGYYQQGRFGAGDDTTSSIQENIIRSCISTLCSKIASQKVRPFFNTVHGSFKDMNIAKQAQHFFDIFYDEINANNIVVSAFRDACIFDTGTIFIDRDNLSIQRVMPWQVYVDPREVSYGNITQVAWCQKDYPASYLSSRKLKNRDTATFWQFWDLNRKVHVKYIEETQELTTESWKAETIPFIFLRYENPVKGSSAESVVDLLYGIQMEVDYLNTVIKEATQRGNILRVLVPDNSSVNVRKLTNRAGEILTYTPIPNQTTPPVMQVSDAPMDPQWLALLQQYKQDAYEMVGISQLSATSKKPKGLDSGIALSTMEDIESDRFETQLNTVIHSYVDIAKAIIEIFPEDAEVLPASKWRSRVTWKDIIEARNNFSIQFSAAEFLSKDPSTKIGQLQALVAGGYLSRARAGMLMQIPDLEQGYSITNNAINAVMAVIEDCLESDIFEIPDYIPIQILKEEILSTMLSLRAAGRENIPDIAKLEKLYQISIDKERDAMTDAEKLAAMQLQEEVQQQWLAAQLPGGKMEQAQVQANMAQGLTPDGSALLTNQGV